MAKRTIEVRWFFDAPPLPSEAFFGSVVPTVERTDWYAFPCHRHNGIKIREGRLETKLLMEDLGEHCWGDVSGLVESWSKWSVVYDGDFPNEADLRRTGWVGVRKRRHWRTIEVTADRSVWHSQRVANGCEVEWSVVTRDDTDWWTIGFEAVGEPSRLHDNLSRAVQHVFHGKELPDLFVTANSSAYPSWLWRAGDGRPPSRSEKS